MFRPQHLLLTLDPLRRQSEPLDGQDLAAAWAALTSLDDNVEGEKHYVVYNGGKEAGSSRKHKHMQLLSRPRKQDGDLELLPYREPRDLGVGALPCVAFAERLDTLQGKDVDVAGRALAEIVAGHFTKTRETLNIDEADKETQVAHNVIMTTDWLMTIPRRLTTIEGYLHRHNVGAQGMLGLVWVTTDEQLEGWRAFGLTNVLRKLGVPKVTSG